MASEPSLLDKWKMMGALMADPHLSDAARRVGFALLNEQRDRGCYPGFDRLIAYTGLSRKGLQKAIGQLEAQGWFTRKVGSGRGNSTRYAWDWQKGEQQYALLMDGVEGKKENARSQKGERTFPKKAYASTPESLDESSKHSAARAGAREAAAGEGVKGKDSTSPASVPADTPDARQGSRGKTEQPANNQAAGAPNDRMAVAEAIDQAHRTLQGEFPDLHVTTHLRSLTEQANGRGRREGPEAARKLLLSAGRDTLELKQIEQTDRRSTG